jgi:hypothetical protein
MDTPEHHVTGHIYTSPLPNNSLSSFRQLEGTNMQLVSIHQARSMHMSEGDKKVLDALEKILQTV